MLLRSFVSSIDLNLPELLCFLFFLLLISSCSIAECILDSSPVFEAFGNAKTLRNDNSSRFGKFISLQFSPGAQASSTDYALVGAAVTTYLLEKTRVCDHHPGERAYHVFYDMLGDGSPGGIGRYLHKLYLFLCIY